MSFIIRELLHDEIEAVETLFAHSLGIVDRIVFGLSLEDAQRSTKKQKGGTLVAELDNEIVGTVSMRIQHIKGERTGFVDALMADKEHRGKGIGTALVDNAIFWLEKRGCKTIYATADRYNSSSWNIFIHRGFRLYEFPQQLKDYGLNFLRLWREEFHFLGFGTFFLRRDTEPQTPREIREAWHGLSAVLGVSTGWWIQVLCRGGSVTLVPILFAVVAISLLTHEGSQKLAARWLGLEATFKAWGSGLLFGWLLTLIGGFFPSHGSTYVKQVDWRYAPEKDRTGILFALGPVVSLTLATAFWIVPALTTSSLPVASMKVGYTMNLLLVIFNLVPIQAAGGFVWDGKKILTWNKTVWAILVIATAVLVTLDVLF